MIMVTHGEADSLGLDTCKSPKSKLKIHLYMAMWQHKESNDTLDMSNY